MTWTPATQLMAVYLVDGEDLTPLPVVAGSLSITGSLDDLCRVCSFSLAGQPDPRPECGDTVLVRYYDFDASLMYDVYGGRLNRPDTESDPWGQDHTASDQLEKLRRTKRGGDMALSGAGRTEGDAVKLILDYCGITYDDADVADAGYVLGLEEPVAWHDDGSTSGAAMVAEFDRVFGMKTMTVGNNRVVRIPYDPTPAASTGAYRTLTKGETADWGRHHRGGGTRDDVVNAWKVAGATIQVSDQCTATVWADAYDAVTELGPRVRTADGTFQSDLIQSEDLAEAVVRRLMRINNRIGEAGSATLGNDPNVYPGTKLHLVDPTYGIGATPRYATVTSYRWSFPTLELDFVAGPPGDEGTVTHGVDKVCNDSHTEIDIPGGGFDFPPFDFPPIDLGDPLDFTPPDLDPLAFVPTGLLAVRAIPPGGSYAGSVTVRLVPNFVCTMYYTDDGSTPTTSSTMYTIDLTISTTTTLKFFGEQDAEHISPVRTEVYTITGGGLGPVIPAPGDWTTEFGVISYPDDGALSFHDPDDAQAYYDDGGAVFPLTEETRFRWSGHIEFNATDEVFIQWALQSGDDTVIAYVEILRQAGGDPYLAVTGFAGGGFDELPVPIADSGDFVFDWNPGAGTLTATYDGNSVSTSLGTWPGAGLYPKISHGTAVTMDTDLTGMVFTIGGG
jgi:hypothetical protein